VFEPRWTTARKGDNDRYSLVGNRLKAGVAR